MGPDEMEFGWGRGPQGIRMLCGNFCSVASRSLRVPDSSVACSEVKGWLCGRSQLSPHGTLHLQVSARLP